VKLLRCAVPAFFAFSTSLAIAQTGWSVAVGGGRVMFDSHSNLTIAGSSSPGASTEPTDGNVAFLIGSYHWSDRWSTRMTFGVPPKTELRAAGTLTSLVPPLTGRMGSVRYAPGTLTTDYAFFKHSNFSAYVGGGLNYTKIVSTEDGDVSNLRVKDAWGAVLGTGFDVQIDKGLSLNVEFKKIYVKVHASGTVTALGNAPVTATMRLDPTILFAGLRYRF